MHVPCAVKHVCDTPEQAKLAQGPVLACLCQDTQTGKAGKVQLVWGVQEGGERAGPLVAGLGR